MNMSESDLRSATLDSQKNSFSRSFSVGIIPGEEILKFLEQASLECKWLHSFESGMTWYLLVKPKTKFLIDSIGLDREILVIVTKFGEVEARTFNHIDEVNRITRTENRFHSELIIVIGQRSANSSAVNSYKKNDCVSIWISDEEIKSENDTCQNRLLSKIQNAFFAKDFFDISGPVSGPQFFGRSKLIQEIEGNFDSKSNVGLFGLRKVGKTSIIKALKENGKSKHIHCVHVDLLSFPDLRKTIEWVLRDVYDDLLNSKIVTLSNRMRQTTDVYEFYSEFLNEFPALLRDLDAKGRRLILILDEIEKLFPTPDGRAGFSGYDDLLSYLRGMSQKYESLRIMVVGVNPHIAEAQLLGKSQNPMFGFFTIKYAPPMNFDEVKEMVKKLGKSSGVDFDRDCIQFLYDALGGHPFLTRKYCSHYIKSQDKPRPIDVLLSDLVSVKSSFFRKEISQFSEMVGVVKDYYPSEFAELHRIAERDFTSEDSISQTILAHLEGYQLVEIASGKVRIKNHFIKEWLTTLSKPDVSNISQLGSSQVPAKRKFGPLKEEISELEEKIRKFIRNMLNSRWKGQADSRIKKAIGDAAWDAAEVRKSKTIMNRGDAAENDILEFLNIGDLSNIVIGNEWDLFRHQFLDKKKIETHFSVLTISRNDLFHSRQIDEIDEMRTKVAIADIYKALG
jgi:hypothetical protein